MNLNHPIVTACLSSALLVVGYASPAQAQVNRRPSAPSALAAAAGQDGAVSLNWSDNSSNETGFKITRTPAFSGGDKVVPANSRTFVDHPGAGRFRYRISAFNRAGTSNWTRAAAISVESNANTAGNPPGNDYTVPGTGGGMALATPNIPSNLIATPGTGQVSLAWRDNSDNEFYFEVQRQVLAGTTWQDNDVIIEYMNHTTHIDMVPNGTYRYRVRAGQFGGISDYTGWTQATVGGSGPTLPNPPSGMQVSDAGSGRAMVMWTDNSNNETSFQLERNPAFATGTMAINANVTSFIDQTGNGTFSYRVSSANAAGSSTPTGWTQVVVTSGSTGGGGGGSGGGGGGGGGGGSGGGAGWTDLTLPAGAQAFYVSSSSGSDSNPGTQAAPFQSIARGYSALRNGQPDQVLLKCGDTWQLTDQITLGKSANSATQYMVIGSYGTGPRPKLRFPANSAGFYGGNSAQRNGFAFVGLDLEPANPGHGGNNDGIVLLSTNGASWDNVLIEDCYISGFSVGIVAQCLVDANTFTGLKIRRCVIVDNDNTSGGHAQGIFLGGAADWLIEECVLDNNARSKADMFCHNLYAHELSGPGTFRGNISSRACSHGGQQRPGGTTDNNLFLQNPINFYQGKSALSIAASTNYFRNNVALDSRNINSVDIRGFGYVIGGAATTIVENNVAAHQESGTGNVTAFDFDGINNGTIRGNVVYDWTYGGAGWGTAFQWDGGSGTVLFENNKAFQPNHGMAVRHEGRALSSSFTYRNNSYYSTNPATGYEQFSRSGGVGGGWSWWQQQAGESGSTFANPGTINVKIDAYLQSIGLSGSEAEFLAQARLQSKQNWRTQFTADGTNDWVRSRLGVGANP